MTKEQLNDCAETLLETVQETITDTIDFYLENNNYQFGENFETEEKQIEYTETVYEMIRQQLKEKI